MKAQLTYLKYKINSSFWFLPGLLTCGAIALALTLVALDRFWISAPSHSKVWLFTAEPETVRPLLTTIAGSMITVTSLVFSITLVALTLASQQLGPRLLESFKQDRANQAVLGIFVGTFVYSLLVLGAVSSSDDAKFVPYWSAVMAVVLSIASFGVLITFFHHLAESIQADFVIAKVFKNLTSSIDKNFPSTDHGESEEPCIDLNGTDECESVNKVEVESKASGYIQVIDIDALTALAREHELCIRLKHKAGNFVPVASPIALIVARKPSDLELKNKVLEGIVIGPKRTPTQDIEYQIRALVEIALRALSPGINDHYTAITCIDRLCASLVQIMMRRMPSPTIRDENGTILVVQSLLDISGFLHAAFSDIRRNSNRNAAVTVRLVQALTTLAHYGNTPNRRDHLRQHVAMIERAANEFIHEPNDLQYVKECIGDFHAILAAQA